MIDLLKFCRPCVCGQWGWVHPSYFECPPTVWKPNRHTNKIIHSSAVRTIYGSFFVGFNFETVAVQLCGGTLASLFMTICRPDTRSTLIRWQIVVDVSRRRRRSRYEPHYSGPVRKSCSSPQRVYNNNILYSNKD